MKMHSLKGKPVKNAPSVVKGKPSPHLLGKTKKSDGKHAPKKHAKEEKSWGAVIKHHVGKGASWAWDRLWRHMFGKTLKQVSALQVRLVKSRREDWQYFKAEKDSKEKNTDSDTTKLLLQEIQLLRSAMRSAVGFKPMRISLTIPFQLTATVTSGVLNTTVSIIPGSSSEFASLAALFDEYKCSGGHCTFAQYIRSGYALGTTGSTLSNSALVLVYDTDSTVLTSVLDGTTFMDHHLYRIGQQAGGVQSNREGFEHFSWRTPPGVGVDTVTPIIESGEWVPTTNTTSTFGFIKSYCQTTEITAIAVASGYLTMHCEFRARQ